MSMDAVSAKNSAEEREALIRHSKVFILKCAGDVCHRHIDTSDDEWSIALSAFNEAIDKYDPSKGSFEHLAYMVIEHRLLDEIRRQKHRDNEVSVEPEYLDGRFDDEEAVPVQVEAAVRSQGFDDSEAAALKQETSREIAEVQTLLQAYDFQLYDVASVSPKARRTKSQCAKAVGCLLNEPDLLASMRRTHALPAGEIRRRVKVSPKVLERHRRYIIAVAEILDGNFPVLASYLEGIRKEMKK